MTLQSVVIREADQLDRAFVDMTRARAGALIVDTVPLLIVHRSRVVDLAAKHRLPAMYHFRAFVEAGGLMSYAASLPDLWRRAAVYVVKILRGARPADLPVEQPTTFELIVNLRAAKALGLTLPPSLLLRADQVLE